MGFGRLGEFFNKIGKLLTNERSGATVVFKIDVDAIILFFIDEGESFSDESIDMLRFGNDRFDEVVVEGAESEDEFGV